LKQEVLESLSEDQFVVKSERQRWLADAEPLDFSGIVLCRADAIEDVSNNIHHVQAIVLCRADAIEDDSNNIHHVQASMHSRTLKTCQITQQSN
jgi:hypothetical protein